MINQTPTITWIHSYKANGLRPNLKRMTALLKQLGNPQNQFPAIHVVGTNGKGSTTSFLQHILTASGYKTGTFISPYIRCFNERIAINGKDIPDSALDKLADQIRPLIEDKTFLKNYSKLTEFELVTAIMFTYFAQIDPVDIAVIEAGIGGLYDSTNVFTAQAVVCPSISLDHQATLGDSLEQIAQHKAGVLKPAVPFIFGQMDEPVRHVFYRQSQALDCPTFELGQDFHFLDNGRAFDVIYDDVKIADIHLQMLGKHQKSNASLAAMTSLQIAQHFPKINLDNIKKGLESTRWPGRCELVRPNLMLDGAHNQDSIAKLVSLLKQDFADKTIHILFAGLKRKPLEEMLNQLTDYDLSVTDFDFYEARCVTDYPDCYTKVVDYRTWLEESKQSNEFYVVTGSLYFISEVRQYLLTALSTDNYHD